MRKNGLKIEREWTTRAGYPAVVVFNPIGFGPMSGFRCGYVGVPAGHPMHGRSYDDWQPSCLDRSGELTFADQDDGARGDSLDGLWVFGWDGAHYFNLANPIDTDGAVAECEALASELLANQGGAA